MPRFKYRTLRVRTWDKHEGNWSKRRGGSEPDRILTVDDSDRPDRLRFADEKDDDGLAFRMRSEAAFLAYLNELGADGWQVASYVREFFHDAHPFPNGDFLLMLIE